jgi:hypothetical protein
MSMYGLCIWANGSDTISGEMYMERDTIASPVVQCCGKHTAYITGSWQGHALAYKHQEHDPVLQLSVTPRRRSGGAEV